MKNKNLIIVLVGLVVLVGLGIFILSSNSKETSEKNQVPAEEQISTIQPQEIGLVLSMSSDSRKIILEVEKTEGLETLDYELSYIAKGDIPRGVLGQIEIKKKGMPIRQEITLGTCSDVCHYDENVSNIKLILKVTKTDGTTGQVEKSLQL